MNILATLLLAAAMQTGNPCDTDAQGPFIITTGRVSHAQWCVPLNQTDPQTNTTVPVTIDGFYVSIDGALRQDVGKATSLGTSSVTNRTAWQWDIPAVQKGNHTFTVVVYNFVRDLNGQPTAERQESAPVTSPFSAVDPVYNLAPPPASGVRIIR